MRKNLNSIFWQEAFEALLTCIKAYIKKYPVKIFTVNFWDNPMFKIGQRKILPPSMDIRERIFLPVHLIDREESETLVFLSREQANEKYQVQFPRIFYNNLITALMNVCFEKNIFYNPFDIYEPIIPTIPEILLKQEKGCSYWSKLIKYETNDNSNISFRHRKWETVMNIDEGTINWIKLYSINGQIKFCNKYKFFHYQLVRYNLLTKRHTVNYRDVDDLCSFCQNEPEKMVHLMFQCTIVQNLINEIRNSINRLVYQFSPDYLNDPFKLLLGHGIDTPDCRNFVLGINIARYVWVAKHKDIIPNLNGFKNFFKFFITKQKFVGKLTCINALNPNDMWL